MNKMTRLQAQTPPSSTANPSELRRAWQEQAERSAALARRLVEASATLAPVQLPLQPVPVITSLLPR